MEFGRRRRSSVPPPGSVVDACSPKSGTTMTTTTTSKTTTTATTTATIPFAEKYYQLFPPQLPTTTTGGKVERRPTCGFVPRQRFLIVIQRGTSIRMYAYNWNQEAFRQFDRRLLALTCWHNARARLLRQIGLQKMGLTQLTNAAVGVVKNT